MIHGLGEHGYAPFAIPPKKTATEVVASIGGRNQDFFLDGSEQLVPSQSLLAQILSQAASQFFIRQLVGVIVGVVPPPDQWLSITVTREYRMGVTMGA